MGTPWALLRAIFMQSYSDLKESILSYLDYYDDEIVSKVDWFIDAAEKEIARLMRLPCYEKIVTLLPSNLDVRDTYPVPSDYIESKDVFVGETSEPVKMSNFSFIMRKRAGIENSTEGSGRYYARIGNNFMVYPALEEGQTLLLNYYSDPQNMKDGIDSSYILTIAPDLILFLSLKHAYVFLANDDAAGKYSGMADLAMEQLQLQVYRMDNKPSQKVVPRRF